MDFNRKITKKFTKKFGSKVIDTKYFHRKTGLESIIIIPNNSNRQKTKGVTGVRTCPVF